MGAVSVNLLIYFYMFICIALLIFNIVYILRVKRKSRARVRASRRWAKKIQSECDRAFFRDEVSESHKKQMSRRLKNVERLIAYHEAMLLILQQNPVERVQRYLDDCMLLFQELAVEYSRKPAMERAFYAHIMSIYHPGRDKGGGQLPEILLTFFEDSTVFCRENILQALCAMGRADMIERALSRMNRQGWYHHSRLLSDGLATFTGDKEQLTWLLWRRCLDWQESFQVAVVQLAAGISAVFAEEFLDALQNPQLLLETRFALLRYFQRHVYLPAQPVLVRMLLQEETSGLSIAAASALTRYPGKDTRRALLQALRSRNWYVRRNAAASLVEMGATALDAAELRAHGDRYAAEMLEYMLELKNPAPAAAGSGKTQLTGGVA